MPRKQSAGFFNIAHLSNSKEAVDYAVKAGANGVEVDLQFDDDDKPDHFGHGFPCDCTCHILNSGICNHISCSTKTNVKTLLNHIAKKKELALVYIDSKHPTSGNSVARGKHVIQVIDKELFGQGYKGNVIVSVAKGSSLKYLKSAATCAKMSAFQDNYYFTIDQSDGSLKTTINQLIELSPYTNNRVYSTGTTACFSKHFYQEILIGHKNQQEGVVGSVFAWTVDDPEIIKTYIEKGVNGIITNQPKVLANVVSKCGLRLADPGSKIPCATNKHVSKSIDSCDCDYHNGGCTISKKASKNLACKCIHNGSWRCKGEDVKCLDTFSPYCKNPTESIESCILGGGDCKGKTSLTHQAQLS